MGLFRTAGRIIFYSCTCLSATEAAPPQSTEAIITGRVVDSRTGGPLAAGVTYHNYETGVSGIARTDARGFYSLPSLTPGTYSLRADSPRYQAREAQALDVYVAARLEINFTLRPLEEVLEPGDYNSALLPHDDAILPALGPDLESGRSAPAETTDVQSQSRQPSLSYVIDPGQIGKAPLAARNVYALTITLPGVAASQVSGRGLQVTANGQRASASNYLLDGVQNNDFVNTGAFSAAAPEAIQEYRVSTNNYSAEYGQTGGFVANAVSRRGGATYHGLVYGYLDNEALDANTFQNNMNGLPRNPFKRAYAGYAASGPVVRNRLFFSSTFEQLESVSLRNPESIGYFLPDQLRQCLGGNSSPMLSLYAEFPLARPLNSAQYTTGGACGGYSIATIREPVTLRRSLALERLDYESPSGRQRLMGRLALSRESQPDFYYSIYRGLSESLNRNVASVAASYMTVLTASANNDLRFGWSPGTISTIRPHPEVPILQLLASTQSTDVSFWTPSAGDPVDFGMKGAQWEINDTMTWTHGRHVLTAGGGILLRRPQYLLSYLSQGLYNFGAYGLSANWTQNFAEGQPYYYELPLNRYEVLQGKEAPLAPPGYNQYSDNQFSGFVQENLRLTPRLALNAGLRYESYGALRNESAQAFFEPGPGQWIQDRIAAASLQLENRSAYRPDRNDWAGRFGISYNPWRKTVLRAGYGIFYDRPFDNLFLDGRNNSQIEAVSMNAPLDIGTPPAALFAGGMTSIVQPLNALNITQLAVISGRLYSTESLYQQIITSDSRVAHTYPLESLWIDRNLRTPYVQSAFVSLQQQVTGGFETELNYSMALGRKLISNDLVNRLCSLDCTSSAGRLNAYFPDILYRSNAGDSDYLGLEFLGRYRFNRGLFQAAYTYSHSIDNISDPMLSDVFNLAFTNLDTIGEAHGFGTFTQQFNSRLDRGSSDFDIRQNLVFYSVWDSGRPWQTSWISRLAENWTIAQMAAIRSGLPFTVFAPYVFPVSGEAFPVGARPSLIDPATVHDTQAVAGGEQLVNLSAMGIPVGQTGNLGRNAFKGPGFWNVDVSLSRSVGLPWLGEQGRMTIGASAFNVLNHSNLGLPDSNGLALYGPTQNQAQFPAALPLFPSPRRFQMQLKVSF